MSINLDFNKLNVVAEKYSKKYVSGKPFPHIYIDDFFPVEVLDKILTEFPKVDDIEWVKFDNPNEKKFASRDELQMGDFTREFIHILNSKPFLIFLEKLTGISNLIPDPHLEGGGLHQIMPGGLLKIHADFNKHSKTNLDRRLNLLVYLNKDWLTEYGGHFELWDKTMSTADVKILPLFNRIAIFSTLTDSYHGHPDPLNCPIDRSRKSIAMYYYTNGRPDIEVIDGLEKHSTIFVNRDGQDEIINYKENKSIVLETIKQFIPPIFLTLKRKFLK